MSFLSFQTALYDELTEPGSDFINTVSGVFDHVPQDYNAFPYVTIGEDVWTDFDTDQQNGHEVSVTLHVWSRERGRAETKTIQEQIYGILENSEMSISGFDLVNFRMTFADSVVDNDGETRHGVQIFTVQLMRS